MKKIILLAMFPMLFSIKAVSHPKPRVKETQTVKESARPKPPVISSETSSLDIKMEPIEVPPVEVAPLEIKMDPVEIKMEIKVDQVVRGIPFTQKTLQRAGGWRKILRYRVRERSG